LIYYRFEPPAAHRFIVWRSAVNSGCCRCCRQGRKSDFEPIHCFSNTALQRSERRGSNPKTVSTVFQSVAAPKSRQAVQTTFSIFTPVTALMRGVNEIGFVPCRPIRGITG
jgi:hypothetical protein